MNGAPTAALPAAQVQLLLRRYAPLGIWTALGCCSFFFYPSQGAVWTSSPIGEYVLASAAAGFGVWGFWRHGGRQITAAGVVCLSCAVMVGFAGLYWATNAQGAFQGSIFAATAWTYFATIAMYALFWSRTEDAFPQSVRAPSTPSAARWATLVGAALVLVCTALSRAGSPGHPLLSGGAFVGTLVLAIGLLSRPGRSKLRIHQMLLVGIAFLLYYAFVFNGSGFNGGGRLIVASLALGIAITFCLHLRGKGTKVLVLCLTVPAFLIAGQIRVDKFASYNYTPVAGGLGSVVEPLQFFGQLIALDGSGELHLGHGSTFVATAVAQVPRAAWPTKPVGFGEVLTTILEPSEVSTGLSLAALTTGEWYFDFGWLGVLVMVLVVGWLVGWLDVLFARDLARSLDTRRRVVTRVLLVVLVAGLTDLYWTGTFTYETRLFMRFVVVLALLAVASRRTQRSVGHEVVQEGAGRALVA
ncbi:MAG TPA: hypothetical protein VGZ03_06655 [Acidimicrobiales bacterium]|nr:hypothetical protein [Acidimicrobiales bacterium]